MFIWDDDVCFENVSCPNYDGQTWPKLYNDRLSPNQSLSDAIDL